MQSRTARVSMVKPVVVVSDAQVFIFARSSSASHDLSVVKEMVKRDCYVCRAVLDVNRSVAFHLVGILARLAVKEVRVVYPYMFVVRVQRYGVVAKEHYAQVLDFHVLCPFHCNAEAVERSVIAYSLYCYILKTAVLVVEPCKIQIVAVLDSRISGIGYSAHHSYDKRSLVVALAVGCQDIPESCVRRGFSLLVFHLTCNLVYVIFRYI